MKRFSLKIVIGFLFLTLISIFAQKVFATIYQPGETLEPDCAPGSLNCGVATSTVILAPDGTALAPSHSFDLDTDTGMYRNGSNFLYFSTGGTDRLLITPTGDISMINPTGGNQLWVAGNGSAITPDITSTSDQNTGLFFPSSNDNWIGFAIDGSEKMRLDSDGLNMGSGCFSVNNVCLGGSGTVTSINASGGTTGLSFSGGPITTSGTLTLGGTLSAVNGGTGLSSITNNSLLIGSIGNTIIQVATSSLGLLTTNVSEGTNLYFTDTRFDDRLGATTTLPNLSVIGGGATTVTLGNTTGIATTTIQSGTGNINFQVVGTTTTGNVQIGEGGSGSATPDLLVLDVKSTAGDPAGIRGAMYYNSNIHVFRCFENSVWRDCETGPRTATLDDSTSDTLTTTEAELIDGTAPSIDPRVAGNRIWITGFANIAPAGGDNETNTFRIRRGSGVCTGTQVGSDITLTTTQLGISGSIAINVIDSPASTSAQEYTLCGLSSTITSPNTIPHLVLTVTEIAAGGADLAELYSTTDSSIEPGDVVAIDPSTEKGVLKTTRAQDPLAIGIISTRPGLLMDGGVLGDHLVQVSLAGRVPVKVNIENGEIKSGDYLTSSSEPGIAMKSSGNGPVIGQALGDYSEEGVGTVLVFIKNFDLGKKIGLVESLTNFITDKITAVVAYFDEIFAKKIHTEELCVKKSDGNEVCVSGDQLNSVFQNNSVTISSVVNPEPEPTIETEVGTSTELIDSVEVEVINTSSTTVEIIEE